MPAPLGNKFALGNSGREKLFDTPEQLDKYINEYFEKQDNTKYQKFGGISKNGDAIYYEVENPYTLEGLCLHLGIHSDTLRNYKRKKGYEEFFDVVIRACLKVTNQQIRLGLLNDYNSRLVQFILTNNAGYVNKIEETKKGDMKHRHVLEVTERQAKELDEFFKME